MSCSCVDAFTHGRMDPSTHEGRSSSLSCGTSLPHFRSHTSAMPYAGGAPQPPGRLSGGPRRRAFRSLRLPSRAGCAGSAYARLRRPSAIHASPVFLRPFRDLHVRHPASRAASCGRPASCGPSGVRHPAAPRGAVPAPAVPRAPFWAPHRPRHLPSRAGGAAASNAALRLCARWRLSPSPARCAAVLAAGLWPHSRPCSIIRVSRGRLGTPGRPPFQTREAARRKPRFNERIAPRRGRHVGRIQTGGKKGNQDKKTTTEKTRRTPNKRASCPKTTPGIVPGDSRPFPGRAPKERSRAAASFPRAFPSALLPAATRLPLTPPEAGHDTPRPHLPPRSPGWRRGRIVRRRGWRRGGPTPACGHPARRIEPPSWRPPRCSRPLRVSRGPSEHARPNRLQRRHRDSSAAAGETRGRRDTLPTVQHDHFAAQHTQEDPGEEDNFDSTRR